MKALLPAAGKGTRISRYLNDYPKCTVDIGNGTPLILYTVRMLKKKGINEIAVVTGYKHEVIEELLKNEGVEFYYNPFFDITNSIASVWMARDFIKDDDFFIMNADVFCEEHLYDDILELNYDIVMPYDTGRKEVADYRFYVENDCIIKYGKELMPEETSGEYVGIGIISKSFLPNFVSKINELISNQQHNKWWENVIYSYSDERDVHVYDVSPKFWAEVDYVEDYERIKQFVRKEL